ncbi:hypothetical protein D4A35_01935 [Paraclostridium bifermentans]|uniref:Uncharacterized protein n=1 Tax=Paraclostridium bifermentans TaxID=1490 RepID=A0A5P3XDI8_PARBF|nr:hypothetical protein [Paraclostridium bifermentans]QEZ67753.1 hypothetical protein D4A35_01935 [Paraclostridium bifermentans]
MSTVVIDEFELDRKINKYRKYYKWDVNRLWSSIDDKSKIYRALNNVEFHINQCKTLWDEGKRLSMDQVDEIRSLMFILGKHIFKGVCRDIDNVKLDVDERYNIIKKFEEFENDIEQLDVWVLNQDL